MFRAWYPFQSGHGTCLANVDLSTKGIDDFLDDIAVATSALVMDLLQGIVGAQLHTGTHHPPQLVSHLCITPLPDASQASGSRQLTLQQEDMTKANAAVCPALLVQVWGYLPIDRTGNLWSRSYASWRHTMRQT